MTIVQILTSHFIPPQSTKSIEQSLRSFPSLHSGRPCWYLQLYKQFHLKMYNSKNIEQITMTAFIPKIYNRQESVHRRSQVVNGRTNITNLAKPQKSSKLPMQFKRRSNLAVKLSIGIDLAIHVERTSGRTSRSRLTQSMRSHEYWNGIQVDRRFRGIPSCPVIRAISSRIRRLVFLPGGIARWLRDPRLEFARSEWRCHSYLSRCILLAGRKVDEALRSIPTELLPLKRGAFPCTPRMRHPTDAELMILINVS